MMLNYLIKTLILAVFSFIIIFFFYTGKISHIENFNGYFIYVLIIMIIYGIYKYLQFENSEKKASFSLLKLGGFFFLHLLVLSSLFFQFNGQLFSGGMALFFKIIFFLILPISIVFISLGFGKKLTSYLEYVKEESSIYKFLISLGLGFFSFVFLLDIFGILGFYNLFVVFFILIFFIIFSHKELLDLIDRFVNYKFEIEIEEGSYLKLISSEFLFLVSTLVICISLISVFRPFPIGWDDLGVYMNQPQLMAQAGEIIALGQMYAWQTFTGIGYMFGSATQAFYLNNVGGILSFIVLFLVIYDLLKSTGGKDKKCFINIPMLVSTIFISMPMIVFQQAKDMKLDPGLFFISVIVLYLVFKYYLNLDNKSYLEKVKGFINDKFLHRTFNVNNLSIILIVGLLSGFAFSIKFTSLLLISGIFGLIFYSRLGIFGFFSYMSFYFAIFTKANLWKMMNVSINPNKIVGFETKVFFIFGFVGILLFVYSLYKNKEVIKKFLLEIGVFFLGIVIALVPWIGKNIGEADLNINVKTLIKGVAGKYEWDKNSILTQKELDYIETNKTRDRISSDGTSGNEDLGRYFGYERGANNYVKLPWNLTMQSNQAGEYTEIGYLFLALIPVLFLFLPFRRKEYAYVVVLFLIMELLVFIKPDRELIEGSNLNISQESFIHVFNTSNVVFKKGAGDSIYDIDVNNYIGSKDINSLVNENNSYDLVKKRATELFYEELKRKVINNKLGEKLDLTSTNLSEKDYNFIKELRILNSKYIGFKSEIDSIKSLEDIIIKNGLQEEKDALINIWKENRSINQFITDILSKISLPYGYLILFSIFFVPTIILLLLVGSSNDSEKGKINLFKINLVFSSFYIFLWSISAFGIVWYGITMYFSFLLAIAIGTYYLSSYSDSDGEKVFFTKLFGSLILSIIVLIYIINNVMPHSFNNLKGAGYAKYKLGDFTPEQANFAYHPEYLKILFYLNIDREKREDFLIYSIDDQVLKDVKGIEKNDIYTVKNILTELKTKQEYIKYKAAAINSLNNIYNGISHPTGDFKNKSGVYRIGTFLKYHISENNKRLLNDNLLFNFNDYIYNTNINKTIDNMDKLGLEYLLIDLNAATIDKDERHNLTDRFEKLLNILTGEGLELVETDSICLKLGLEEFKKSSKFSTDRERFMQIAGVNYESYTEKGEVIPRGNKLFACYTLINDLLKIDKIDGSNYNYLLNLKNYINTNKDNFKTDSDVYKFLQKQVSHGYKALFEVNIK